MDVLIAGCGWLGSEIARRLVARGDRVVAVRRDVGPIEHLRTQGIEVASADFLVPGELDAAVGVRFDAVVACQAAGGPAPADYRRAYADGNRALARYADRARATRFVYTGSTGVFGRDDGSTVDETTAPDPATATGRALLDAELVALAAGCLVRLSGLYGVDRTGILDRVRRGALALGPGDDAWMNFCHRDDAATAVVAALDAGQRGATYHGTDADPTRRRDVVRWIAGRLGIDPPTTTSEPARRGNRRVLGERTRAALGFGLAYPSFRDGLAAALDADTTDTP